MSELQLPASPEELVERLRFLHKERKKYPRPPRRLSLTPGQRAEVLNKTDARCHLCGGEIARGSSFAADHVLAHAAGGQHKVSNYLPSHRLCNRCRWFYSPEEFQWILKIGVWARKQMEDQNSKIGIAMLPEFWRNETIPHKRRKRPETKLLRSARVPDRAP
jgi:hypothetical protein